jgi:hypothetical protein
MGHEEHGRAGAGNPAHGKGPRPASAAARHVSSVYGRVACRVPGPNGYELYGELETKTKFWGKTIDLILAGHLSLRFKAWGEEYR